MKGRICSINLSKNKGTGKNPVNESKLIKNFGLETDAHSGPGIRQVSLLALESINEQNSRLIAKELKPSLKKGDFAENITTQGIRLLDLKIGDRLKLGARVVLEISKIGKECHKRCAIYYKIGDCIMPREGIFAKVIKGGVIRTGDSIEAGND